MPSDFLDIEDKYTAYCFNEAIAFITQKLKNGEEPMFKTHYTRPSDLYKKYQK